MTGRLSAVVLYISTSQRNLVLNAARCRSHHVKILASEGEGKKSRYRSQYIGLDTYSHNQKVGEVFLPAKN